jgi:hypothetical protein
MSGSKVAGCPLSMGQHRARVTSALYLHVVGMVYQTSVAQYANISRRRINPPDHIISGRAGLRSP